MKTAIVVIVLLLAGMLLIARHIGRQRRRDINQLPDGDPPEPE